MITPVIDQYEELVLLSNISELPSFYNQRSKRLKSNEQQLFNKQQLLSSKIENIDLAKKNEAIKARAVKQKVINHLVNEIHYYETILDELKDIHQKDSSGKKEY